MKISRREMIKGLAAITSGMAFGNLAHGATLIGSPRRVVFIYTPEGVYSGKGGWAKDWVTYQSQTNFTPIGIAAPLARHKSEMVMFENMATIFDSKDEGGIETHLDGKAFILTNTDMVNNAYGSQKPQGQSLDNFLAGTIGKMYTPAWPSLQLGIATDNSISSTMTFLPNGSPVISQRDPAQVYKNLFSTNTLSTVLSRRKAVIGQVNNDLNRFLTRLSTPLKSRAASAVDAVHTLEQQLTTSGNACSNPAQPKTTGLNLADGKNALTQGAAMNDLIVSAFACDLTRVVSLVYHGVFGNINAGMMAGVDDNVHSISHYANSSSFNAVKLKMFEQIASFIDSLKAIPEGTGTMLDNTLVCLVTEVNANHELAHLPFVTIGGKNLGVQVGNYLKLPTLAQSGKFSQGFPHGNFLRSVIKAMGLPEQTFGNPKYSDRLVPGFLA